LLYVFAGYMLRVMSTAAAVALVWILLSVAVLLGYVFGVGVGVRRGRGHH
jgi:hypothetical protein